jgi:thiol-disulfide isomerase/thioredoxin
VSQGPLRLALAGFTLLFAAVLGAFVYERVHAPVARNPGVAASMPEPPGAPVASSAPLAPARVPSTRPDFSLKDLAGRSHPISEWDGKALLVNFWATWCAPCRREIPLLNRIQREYAGNGFEVVGIAVDFADDVKAFRKDFPIDYPLLVGEQDGFDAARAFGIETMALPFTAFTDSHGRVLMVHVGELHEDQARAILAIVQRVDAGALTPVEAGQAMARALTALPKAPATPAG